jgi:hypothetical protein
MLSQVFFRQPTSSHAQKKGVRPQTMQSRTGAKPGFLVMYNMAKPVPLRFTQR